MMEELDGYDALALGSLVRQRRITPLELVEDSVERIEKINPRLNAVIHKLYDRAREQAESWQARLNAGEAGDVPFCGVPFLLKDLLAEYKGAPLWEGSRAVKGHISDIDSELVKRQVAAGLIIVGKTNTPEFGYLPLTDSAIFGPTLNPWDVRLTPGGSSGGSAAAVASGMVPMAHGNDGGGSLRTPASCCGLFALKPTRGRNPVGPLFGDLAGGLVSEHAVTRTVRDSAALLDATSGPDIGDPYWAPPQARPYLEEVGRDPGRLKIGFLTGIPERWSHWTDLHPLCLEAVNDAARLCETLGHTVEEIDPWLLQEPRILDLYNNIWSCFIGHFIAYWERKLERKIGEEELEPLNWQDYRDGLQISGRDYMVTLEFVQLFSRQMAHWYEEGGYDLLLNPTMRIPPSPYGTFAATKDEPQKLIAVARSFSALSRIQNLTGQPAMSVPLFWSEDEIPIGVQFAARFGDEATLFRLAAQLEQARPWSNRLPRIHWRSEK
jgi:amidase